MLNLGRHKEKLLAETVTELNLLKAERGETLFLDKNANVWILGNISGKITFLHMSNILQSNVIGLYANRHYSHNSKHYAYATLSAWHFN